MENTYSKNSRAFAPKSGFQARLNLLPYDGTPEVKDRDGAKNISISVSVLEVG